MCAIIGVGNMSGVARAPKLWHGSEQCGFPNCGGIQHTDQLWLPQPRRKPNAMWHGKGWRPTKHPL
jgi:hypothetical protein